MVMGIHFDFTCFYFHSPPFFFSSFCILFSNCLHFFFSFSVLLLRLYHHDPKEKKNKNRKLEYSVEAIRVGAFWVGVNTALPNILIQSLFSSMAASSSQSSSSSPAPTSASSSSLSSTSSSSPTSSTSSPASSSSSQSPYQSFSSSASSSSPTSPLTDFLLMHFSKKICSQEKRGRSNRTGSKSRSSLSSLSSQSPSPQSSPSSQLSKSSSKMKNERANRFTKKSDGEEKTKIGKRRKNKTPKNLRLISHQKEVKIFVIFEQTNKRYCDHFSFIGLLFLLHIQLQRIFIFLFSDGFRFFIFCHLFNLLFSTAFFFHFDHDVETEG